MTQSNKISINNTGFSANPFMMGYDSHIYQADAELGFIFPKEQLVETKKFVSLNSILHSIKKDKQKLIPAVTHVDGSVRLQTIRKHQNPLYYQLIKEFGKISGVPILVNASSAPRTTLTAA